MKRLLILLLFVSAVSCTNGDKTKEILQNEGFTDIQLTGYEPFMCSDQDVYSTGFIATNPAGKRVTGAVCGGWDKGYTIRYK